MSLFYMVYAKVLLAAAAVMPRCPCAGESLLNRAQQQLAGPAELVVIPGATHLFEEPGALDEVARLATDWFARHLCGV
jgi:hypothetical protein